MSNNVIVMQAGRSLLLAFCMLLTGLSAQAAGDPLELPAPIAANAAKATGAMLLGVAKAGARLVAVGERGIIVYSDDQGRSWAQAAVPVSVTLTAVQFPTPRVGWAVGHDGAVLRSTDGGKTWTKRFDGNQGNALMLAEAEKNAAAAGKAADAITGSGTAKAAATAARQAAENALADVQAGVKFGPSRPLLGLLFTSASEGYVVGAYGQIFHTADGGNNWESLAGRLHNPDGLHFNSIAMTAAGALVIAGEGGKVYRSDDKGANWQNMDTGYQGQLYGVLGVAGLPGNKGGAGGESLLAFGFGGHMLLAGDGQHWQELPAAAGKNLVGGTRTADGVVLLASQDGGLLHSADQGRSFTMAQDGSGLAIAGMVLLDGGEQVALSGIGGVHLIPVISVGSRGK